MIDIVIPNNNEEEFIAMAEELGYKGLCFLYSFNDYPSKQKKSEVNKIKICGGVLADNRNIYEIKNILEKQSFSGCRKNKAFSSELKEDKVFVAVRSSNNDREIMEKSKPDLIFSFEDIARKDFIHQRASGLNHILCKSAKENKVMIGFSLSSILNAENKNFVLGRMTQNIQLCRKFKVKTIVASFAQNPFEMRSAHDLITLFKILGLKNPSFLKKKI
jgi:RNase P/RNase MRP subunit p30